MESELVFWRPRGGRACPKNGRDRAIQAAYLASLLNATDVPDLEELRTIAREVGFLSPEIRRQAWPLLLGVKAKIDECSEVPQTQALSTTHKDNKQVQLDVIRSMCNFGMRKSERERRLGDLSTVIDSILAANPDLHYYQGFNDVMGDVERSRAVAERLAKFHFREAMNATLLAVQQALKIILRIVERRDKKLFLALEETGVEPIYAISWILTWFAHDLRSLSQTVLRDNDDGMWTVGLKRDAQIERLYDFFIASHPLMSLYLSASVLCHFRKGIIEAEGDYAVIHNLLQTLPSDLPLDKLIHDSCRMFEKSPPPTVIAAASLERERAFTPDSPWRIFPHRFADLPGASSSSSSGRGGGGRLIAWKREPERRARGRTAISGKVGVLSGALLGGYVLVKIAPGLVQIVG